MEQNKLNLVQITAPGLNKSNYGEQLDQQFQNIDSNFKKIVSTDYLKGNTGDSVQLIEVEFKEGGRKSLGLYLNDEELTDGTLYDKIKQAILSALSKYVGGNVNENNINVKSQLINVGKLTWEDWLKQSNKMTFLYKTNDSNKKVIISSLQYTFMDTRFNNIQYSNISSYEGAVDLSCIIFLSDNNGTLSFSRINTFPTIYYDTNMESADSTEYNRYGTFCWRINGNDTGIPAVGPRGKTGKDNKIYVVRVDKNTDASNECNIKEVLYVSDTETYFMPLDEFIRKDEHFDEGVFVLAIKEFERVSEYASGQTADSVSDGTHMWASPLIVDVDVINGQEIKIYKAYCDDSNSILNTYEAQSILNAMCSMYDSSVFHGLVIPISGPEKNLSDQTEQAAHMIYALKPKVVNGKEYNECVNLVIAPMDNIHDKPTARNYGDDGTYNDLSLETSISFLYDTTRIGNKLQAEGDVNMKNDLSVEGSTVLNGLIAYGNSQFDSAVFRNDGTFKMLTVGGNISNSYDFEFLTRDSNNDDVFSIFVGNAGTSRLKQHYKNNDINLQGGGVFRIYGGSVTNTIADNNGDITTTTVDNDILKIDFTNYNPSVEPDADGMLPFQGLDDVLISLYKNTEIYGNLDVNGYLEAASAHVEQQLVVDGHIKAYNIFADNGIETFGDFKASGNIISNGQLKVAGNSSIGGGLLTAKVDKEDEDENYIDIDGDCYLAGTLSIGKRKSGGGGTGSMSEDPLGGLTGSNSENYTGEDSLLDGIKIYPDKTIDELTKNFTLTRDFKNEGAWGAIVNYGTEERNWWGPYSSNMRHVHNISKKNGITSLFSGNKFKDSVSHTPDRWWQLHRLWSWPLSQPINGWVNRTQFNMNGEWTQTVWTRSGNDNVDEYKLKFDKDISVLFSVSGRNLYNRPWLRKASWAIPRWRSASMTVNIITTYGSTNGGQDTHHTENIVTAFKWVDCDLFNNWNTKDYDEDKVNRSSKPNYHWGDTVIGAFTVSPNRYEYSIDGTNLKSIKIFVGVYFDFYRTLTHKENQVYKTWRSAKILGVLPSTRSANGTIECKLIDRWFNHSGTTQTKPLDDQGDQAGIFNKLMYNGKFDDVGVVYLPQKKLTNATKKQIQDASTGEFSGNTFNWGPFGEKTSDKMDIYLYGNQPKFIPIINVESVNVSSNFQGGNVHICPDGIMLVSPTNTTSASGDDLNFAYLEVGEDGQPVTINAVTTIDGTTKKASISLYNLIKDNGGTVSDWKAPE